MTTSHPFKDGSGRVSVGVADVILQRLLGKKLDMKKIGV